MRAPLEHVNGLKRRRFFVLGIQEGMRPEHLVWERGEKREPPHEFHSHLAWQVGHHYIMKREWSATAPHAVLVAMRPVPWPEIQNCRDGKSLTALYLQQDEASRRDRNTSRRYIRTGVSFTLSNFYFAKVYQFLLIFNLYLHPLRSIFTQTGIVIARLWLQPAAHAKSFKSFYLQEYKYIGKQSPVKTLHEDSTQLKFNRLIQLKQS